MVRVPALLFLLALLPATPPASDMPQDVAAGIALAKEGDFEAAVIALDAAVRRLEGEGAPGKVRALAQLHLGIAYLELDQDVSARARFGEALDADPELALDPRAFSAQVMRVFEAVRRDRAALPPKKGSRKGLLLLGGVAVVGAGVAAVAGGGGGGGSGTSTTTARPPLETQPTTTTAPGATTSTTLPTGTTTTTTPPTTTPPTTTPPTTTPPTTPTTTMPPCRYDAHPSTSNFTALGGSGTCEIDTGAGCRYTATSTASFVRIQSGGSGTGFGSVGYVVDANAGSARAGAIVVDQDSDARCEIRQAGVLLQPTLAAPVVLVSTLDLADGSAQIVVDGRHRSFVGRAAAPVNTDGAPRRVEGTVVGTSGRPGTWLFILPPGSSPPRVIAGQVVEITPSHLRFSLTGQAAERVLFVLPD